MQAIGYGKTIEEWKTQLVRSRARRLGIQGHDLDDVQQELALEILAFRYDAGRSNGATERTALTALIDHRLISMLRKRQRRQNRLAGLEPKPEVDDRQDLDHRGCQLDVQSVLAELNDDDRELCDALADGTSIGQIAAARGVSWHTVERRVAQLRELFESRGLDGWVRQ